MWTSVKKDMKGFYKENIWRIGVVADHIYILFSTLPKKYIYYIINKYIS